MYNDNEDSNFFKMLIGTILGSLLGMLIGIGLNNILY